MNHKGFGLILLIITVVTFLIAIAIFAMSLNRSSLTL